MSRIVALLKGIRFRWAGTTKPLKVRLQDPSKIPLPCEPLTFAVTKGNGQFPNGNIAVTKTNNNGLASVNLHCGKIGLCVELCKVRVEHEGRPTHLFTIFVISRLIFSIIVICLFLAFVTPVGYNYWQSNKTIGSLYIPNYLPEGTTGKVTFANGKSKSWHSSDKNQLIKFKLANEPRKLYIQEVPKYCGSFSYPFDNPNQRYYIAYVKRAKNVSPTEKIIVKIVENGENELFRANRASNYPHILFLLVEEDDKEQTIKITYTDIYDIRRTFSCVVSKKKPVEDPEW